MCSLYRSDLFNVSHIQHNQSDMRLDMIPTSGTMEHATPKQEALSEKCCGSLFPRLNKEREEGLGLILFLSLGNVATIVCAASCTASVVSLSTHGCILGLCSDSP